MLPNRLDDPFPPAVAARPAFAADASHELRAPLTTIRGYAELYGQGALGPDQLPNAIRRIDEESQRMSRPVAELLELARLDRTSSLNLTETDLAVLVGDAAADASTVEPGRPVQGRAQRSRESGVRSGARNHVRVWLPAQVVSRDVAPPP